MPACSEAIWYRLSSIFHGILSMCKFGLQFLIRGLVWPHRPFEGIRSTILILDHTFSFTAMYAAGLLSLDLAPY